MKIVNVIKKIRFACSVEPASRERRKRYSLAKLLKGASVRKIKALNTASAWALDGTAVGLELV